jgi:HSP20 family protein
MGQVIVTGYMAERKDRPSSGHRSFFDNLFSSQHPLFSLSEKVWNPPTDVYETGDSVVIRMEIAGVSLDALDVRVEDRLLIIRGCRRENPCLDKEDFHLMEIRYGAFERAFALPAKTRPEEIQAQYTNGFLIVTIAKQQATTREILVQVVDP